MSNQSSYENVNDRLKEIVEEVSDETLPLDDALDLFEEAVKLGMEASTMMEEDMAARDAAAEADEAAADAAFEAVVNDEEPVDVATPEAEAAIEAELVSEAEVEAPGEAEPEAEVGEGNTDEVVVDTNFETEVI